MQLRPQLYPHHQRNCFFRKFLNNNSLTIIHFLGRAIAIRNDEAGEFKTVVVHKSVELLAQLRRCASRVSFRSKSLGPINQHQWPCRPPYLPPCRPPCPTPCQPIFCRSSCRPPCGTTCWPIFFVVCHIVHLHTDVHLHVSHHGGHHNVVSTHCEVSETVTEWKSESVTKDACASKNTQSCTDLLID